MCADAKCVNIHFVFSVVVYVLVGDTTIGYIVPPVLNLFLCNNVNLLIYSYMSTIQFIPG